MPALVNEEEDERLVNIGIGKFHIELAAANRAASNSSREDDFTSQGRRRGSSRG